MKICRECCQNLDLSSFTKNTKNKDLLQKWCKDCDKKRKAKFPSYDKNKLKEYAAQKYIEQKEQRSEYAKKKYLEKREENLARVKAYAEKTKESKAEYDKLYREQNKAKIAEYKKQWAGENAEQITERMIIYRKENAEKLSIEKSKYAKNNRIKINAKASIYVKKRCEEDPLFKLKKNTRKMVSRYMLGEKSKRTQEIIGCTYEELKLHIENQFTKGMTWENYGFDGWHIDHIKPLAMASTKEEIIASNHYLNLQPMWALDNFKKGATFDGVNYKTKQ